MNFKQGNMCKSPAEVSSCVSGCNDQPSRSRLCEEVVTQSALPIILEGKSSIKSDQAKAEHMTGWNRFDFQARLSIFFKA